MEKIKNKKILIAGGTGFIGSHLVKRCSQLGLKVTSLSLKKRKKNYKLKNVKYIYSNFANTVSFKKKIKSNFDYIVNLGGYIDHSTIQKKKKIILKNHFYSTVNLISLNNKKLKRYIHIGTSDEYGFNKSPVKEIYKTQPKSYYALAKSMSTNLLMALFKENKFPVTILRLFLVYGPKQKKDRLIPYVISNSIKNRSIYLSRGNQLRDFSYVDNIIDAIILCLRNKKSVGQIFNIGSAQPISVKEMVNKIIKTTGRGKAKFNYLKTKRKQNLKLYPSINKIKKMLGWKPKILLDEGLKRTIDFYKTN